MNHELDIDDRDLEWTAGQQPQRISSEPFVKSDPFARERAMQALRSHIDADSGRRGFDPRRLLRARTIGFAVAAGAAALLAVAILTSGGDTHSTQQPLMRLADYVGGSPEPTGNATVVQRTTTMEGKTATVYDLYADGGGYYFSESRRGLTGAIAEGRDEGGGTAARELAAAEAAASGDVGSAAEDMAKAPDPSHPYRPGDREYANRVWEWSQEAMIAGAGRPQVRAGVLKILGTLKGVTVAEGTADGASTLVLTAGPEEMGADYTEQLTIDASTGVPIAFVGGPTGGPPATEVEYQVSRADYAGLATPTAGN